MGHTVKQFIAVEYHHDFDVCVMVHHQYSDISNQQDAAKYVLLIVSSLLHMFRATVLPIFRNTLTVYTAFWNNVQTVLSAASW